MPAWRVTTVREPTKCRGKPVILLMRAHVLETGAMPKRAQDHRP